MTAFIEANFFRCNGDMIIKELAVYFTDTNYDVYIFKSPGQFNDLSPTDKMQCLWLTRHICDLTWNEGDYNFDLQSEIAFEIRQKATSFITKGLSKAKVLSRFLNTTVLNVEDLGCPRLDTLVCETPRACTFHRVDNNCPLVKACGVASWLRQQKCLNSSILESIQLWVTLSLELNPPKSDLKNTSKEEGVICA